MNPECAELLERLAARGVILIVTEGIRGSGFSIAMAPEYLARMPEMLESVASQIRQDIASVQHPGKDH